VEKEPPFALPQTPFTVVPVLPPLVPVFTEKLVLPIKYSSQ